MDNIQQLWTIAREFPTETGSTKVILTNEPESSGEERMRPRGAALIRFR